MHFLDIDDDYLSFAFSSLGDCQEVNDMDMGGPGPADGVEEALAL